MEFHKYPLKSHHKAPTRAIFGKLLRPWDELYGDPLVFDSNTNTIKNLTKILIGLDPRRPPNESPITLPTSGRSFDEILESIINNLPKIPLLEREDLPPHCVVEEETSIDNANEASETSNSSEIHHKTRELVSLRKNSLYRCKSKMASNGHPENFRPQQPMGNINQTKNNQEALVHKQNPNNANPFASHGPTIVDLGNNIQTRTNNAQPN
eukprot:Gb_17035 [translate_table: standard]